MTVLENLSIAPGDGEAAIRKLQQDINVLDALATDNVSVMTTANITGLTSVQLAGMTTTQFSGLTTAQVTGGVVVRTGISPVFEYLPTAAALVAAIPHATVGMAFDLTIRNNGSGTLTVTENTGVTASGTMTLATNTARRFSIVLTNVTASSEAYTIYNLGVLA